MGFSAKSMRLHGSFLVLASAAVFLIELAAEEGAPASGRLPPEAIPFDSVPEAPSSSDFEALRKTSPFTRVLSLSATYALRGVATINDEQVATLYNRETKKTVVVTREGNHETGIALVDVTGAPQLDGVTAKISFAGDEAELKYETSQLYPTPKGPPGSPGQPGRPPEGEHRGPSPQDVERYKALPEEKQAKLREYIGHVMKNYPNLSREERGNMIRGAMMRLTDGRDLEIPQTPPTAPGNSPGAPQGASGQPQTSSREGTSGSTRSETRDGDRRGDGRDRGDRGERRERR